MPNAGGRLEGKTAIITGAGSSGPGMGNGKATAILFAREGARVLLADLHEDRARETLVKIEAEGGVASTIEVDVTVEEDARRLAETAIERYGRIDVLVNNVGISKRGSVLDVTPEEWDRVMVVNVKSMMLCSRHVVPRMKEGGGGSIINIASTAGLRAHHSTPYTTSKAAVIGLTFSMAADHGPDNIRVNAIAPGLVYTPMVAPRMEEGMREKADGGGASRDGGDGVGCRVGGGVSGERRGSVDNRHHFTRRRGSECDHGHNLPAAITAEVEVGLPSLFYSQRHPHPIGTCRTL